MAAINWVDPLSKAKQDKLDSLSAICTDTILGRFSFEMDGNTYYFSSDMKAQANFEKCARAFDKGLITELPWTAYTVSGEVVRLQITNALFNDLYIAHLGHIQGNISKFRDVLMPQVQAATTIGEVEAVTW